MQTIERGGTSWVAALKAAYAAQKYNKVRNMLNQRGYTVPGKGSPTGRLFLYAYNFAASGATPGEFRQRAPQYDKYWKNLWVGTDPNDRAVVGSDRTAPGRRTGRDVIAARNKKNKKTPGSTTPGAAGGGTVGASGPTSVSPVDWKQFMIQNLQTPASYARNLTNLEFNGALRDINRLLVDEKRRGKNIDSWVNKSYDPMIEKLTGAMRNQDAFTAANQQGFVGDAATSAGLFGDSTFSGAGASAAAVNAQNNQADLASLGQLQHQQNLNTIGEGQRMKVLRRDELTDRSKDQLTALRDKMLGLRADRRAAYNKYLVQAQNMKQGAIAQAVDIAGALQNQNLAQAMSGYQLQQAALDTQAMADQIGFNRKQQAWTDLMNQAGLDNLTSQGRGARTGFIPWNQLVEGDRRNLIGSIIEPYVGVNQDTGAPELATSRANAKDMIIKQLAAAGYAVKKNKAIGRWVDAYLNTLPGGSMYGAGTPTGDYWSGIGSALEGL